MTDNQLTESWDKVFQASQQAIDWVMMFAQMLPV